jgi:hypothetical protein
MFSITSQHLFRVSAGKREEIELLRADVKESLGLVPFTKPHVLLDDPDIELAGTQRFGSGESIFP